MPLAIPVLDTLLHTCCMPSNIPLLRGLGQRLSGRSVFSMSMLSIR